MTVVAHQSSCRPVEAIGQQLEIVGSARGKRISLRVGSASDSRSIRAVGGSGGCASVAGGHRPSGDLGPQAAETRPARTLAHGGAGLWPAQRKRRSAELQLDPTPTDWSSRTLPSRSPPGGEPRKEASD
jgi:hypothetical protein